MNLFDDIEQTTVFIRDAIRDIPTRHAENVERLKQLQYEENDIRHLYEFGVLNAVEICKLYAENKALLQERRKLKNENELLEPLINTMKKFRNNLGELDKVVGEVRKTKKDHQHKQYTCRVRTDLQSKFEVS